MLPGVGVSSDYKECINNNVLNSSDLQAIAVYLAYSSWLPKVSVVKDLSRFCMNNFLCCL